MAKRKIIEIDRDRCDGCGLCTTACAEGALALDAENKAVLVREIFCDGLGACLDVCPTDALKVVERESDEYDAGAAFDHVLKTRGAAAAASVHGAGADRHAHAGHSGCPGSLAREIPCEPETGWTGHDRPVTRSASGPSSSTSSRPWRPYFEGSDLLVAADCTAFALGGFHEDLLKGKKLVIACPKLDETARYVEKLAEIIKQERASAP